MSMPKKSRILPQHLSEILGELTMNQEEFGDIFKVSQTTVSRWLSGVTPVPGYVEAWLKAVHPAIMRRYKHEE